jgi:hypothetical protein
MHEETKLIALEEDSKRAVKGLSAGDMGMSSGKEEMLA